MRKPSRAELQAAANRIIPDHLPGQARVWFVGINPSLYSAATGHHFARPGNRFWPALHQSGFTPRQFHPSEDWRMPELGLGLTNLVARATARADELSQAELVEGGESLRKKVRKLRPHVLAFVGITAYRSAMATPQAVVGPQAQLLDRAQVWVLPNPSGLNAHYQLPAFVELFTELYHSVPKLPAR